jgi:hypothetical protein
MTKGNIQLQVAARLLIDYLLEQNVTLNVATATQSADEGDNKTSHETRIGCHSESSSDSSDSSIAPGSSSTMS